MRTKNLIFFLVSIVTFICASFTVPLIGLCIDGDNVLEPLEAPIDSDFTSNGRMERKGDGDYTIASTDYVNAAWYGSNYTAIQTAIDTGAARVYVPSGTWSVTGNGTTADGIRLRSNLELFGDGANETIISQASSAQFAVAVGTSAGEGGNTTADNYKNIYIHDLQVLGDVVTSGFSEQYHTMTISGVSDVLIERVWFEGFRGDGLYLGSTHIGATERHNERVTVRDCIFDGINKDNRNGLTVIDCDGLLVENNYFTRTSKSTMAGAIDMEPNSNSFAIIKDITITKNKFYDIGGISACITYKMPLNQAALTNPSRCININNNHLDTCAARGIYLNQTGTVSNSTILNNIRIEENSISNCTYGLAMRGVKGVTVKDNVFRETSSGNAIGSDTTAAACRDIILSNNTFLHCGTSGGTGLVVYYSDVLTFDHNLFDDCGNSTTHGYGMYFGAAGSSSYVKLLNNTFIAPTGITTVAVKKHASHTFTSATNQYRGNDLHGLSNEFVSTNLWTDAEISDDLTLAKLQLDHNVETLAANKTLIITDKVIQKLDPDGTDRNVLLPVENTATDLTFFIYNMGGEVGEDLNVQDDAAVDILSIGYLQLGFCTCDGTTWTVRCFSCAEAVCCINLRAKEENTSAIVIGQPVYISGATGIALPNAGLADCDDSSKIRVKGLVAEDISQNSTGYIRVKGLLEDVNSTKGSPVNALSQDWTAGDQLWVSTTVGSLTNVRPIGRSVKIGTTLTVEGVSSKILVDVRENSIYTGAASGEDITRQMGDSAGANKIIYEDFAGNEVASIDSDGNAEFTGISVDASAIPTFYAKDSGAPGTDKDGGNLWWNYIDGADGSENFDFGIRITQGGVEDTTILLFDESDDQWETTKKLFALELMTHSATPKLIFSDWDGADAYIDNNAADADDAVMTFGVDDSGGDDQSYIELDGVNERIELKEDLVCEVSLTTQGSDPTVMFDEADGTDWELRVDDAGNSFEIASSTGAVGDNVEVEIDEDGDVHATGDVYTPGVHLADADASPNAVGEVVYDNNVTDQDDGSIAWYDDDEIKYIVSIPSGSMPGAAEDDYVIAYDQATDKYYFKADADSGGATAWDDIGNPDNNGLTTVDFNHASENTIFTNIYDAAGTFFKIDNTDADLANNTYLFGLEYTDDGQANADFFYCADNNGDIKFSIQEEGNTATGTLTTAGDIKQQFDAAAFLTISTADGGASTISQTSDGQDQIIIGDGSDSTVIKVAAGADAMADDNYSGIVLSGWNCGEAITQWDTVYLDDTSNEWMQADADAAGEFPARGVAVAACTNGNPGIILVQGTIRNDGWTWTGNGKTLYLSDTVAGMAEAAPSTANDCVQVVGFTLDDDTVYVNFSGHWLLVE